MCGGRLRSRGKSMRPEAPPDGYRSDSIGIVDQFPSQRSSGSGLEVLRLPHPEGSPGAEIFSRLRRCPPYMHTAASGRFLVVWGARDDGAW